MDLQGKAPRVQVLEEYSNLCAEDTDRIQMWVQLGDSLFCHFQRKALISFVDCLFATPDITITGADNFNCSQSLVSALKNISLVHRSVVLLEESTQSICLLSLHNRRTDLFCHTALPHSRSTAVISFLIQSSGPQWAVEWQYQTHVNTSMVSLVSSLSYKT